MRGLASAALLVGAALPAPPPALARDLLLPGADIKDHAAIGAVVGDDPTSLFYNPANLAVGTMVPVKSPKPKPKATDDDDETPPPKPPSTPSFGSGFAEMALTNIHATYVHPGYDTFTYNAVAPLMTIGGAYQSGDRFALGLAIFPTGDNSTIKIANLPVDIVKGTSDVAQVTTTVTGYSLALGGAVRLGDSTRIGLSIVQTYAHDKIHIDLDGVPQPLDDADIHGTFYKPILGLRQNLGQTTVALSVSPPEAQHYQGTSEMPALGFPDPYNVEMTTYVPLTVQAGVAVKTGKLVINGEVAYEAYGAGQNIAKSGMNPNDTSETNLKNTVDFAASGDYAMSKRQTLFAGLGYFPSDQGGGLYSGTRGPDDHGEAGMRFGNFDGYNRFAAGGGYRQRNGLSSFELGVFGNYGTTTVPATDPQQGVYDLLVIGVTGGYQLAF